MYCIPHVIQIIINVSIIGTEATQPLCRVADQNDFNARKLVFRTTNFQYRILLKYKDRSNG